MNLLAAAKWSYIDEEMQRAIQGSFWLNALPLPEVEENMRYYYEVSVAVEPVVPNKVNPFHLGGKVHWVRKGSARATFAVRPLLEATARRWGPQATLRGGGLTVRWRGEEAAVAGDRLELAAALDNLVANALEHGGARIELTADLLDGRICLAVVDSGAGAGRRAREREAAARARAARRRRAFGPMGRLSGRARHGPASRRVLSQTTPFRRR